MAITLPKLPYALDALQPHMSRETLEYHYGKHHKTYVDKVNELAVGTEFEDKTLDEIVLGARGKLFNNAAQAWNHNFFWRCLTPRPQEVPEDLSEAFKQSFGSVEAFQKQFSQVATNLFGSGWAWLVATSDGSLDVVATKNAGNPMTDGLHPLLACDVWEHAYYIDYRNARPAYLQQYWSLVNWDWVREKWTAAANEQLKVSA